MTVAVSRVGDGESLAWDSYVSSQRGFTHFHRYGWRSVLADEMGCEPHYLVARDSHGALCGALPLFRVRSMIFGDYLVSVPYLNYGGPLGSDAGVSALAAEGAALADELGVDLLELRARGELSIPLQPSLRKVTVVLDIPEGGAEELFRGFSAKLRSQVRRPAKEGVVVEFGADRVRDFYTVFARHMRDLGTPVLPRSLFERVAAVFGDSFWVGVSYLNGRPVAGGCAFVWGDEIEMTWASSLLEYARTAPNMLLYWSFMERAANAGVRRFNFGRCTPGGGTHRFKLQWGGRDEQLYWYQHMRGVEKTPSPDGSYSLAVRLWRKLPVPIATFLGPRIVRGIP